MEIVNLQEEEAKLVSTFCSLTGTSGADKVDMSMLRDRVFSFGVQGMAEKLAENIHTYRRGLHSPPKDSAEHEKMLSRIIQDTYYLFLASVVPGPGARGQDGQYGPVTEHLRKLGYYSDSHFAQCEKE